MDTYLYSLIPIPQLCAHDQQAVLRLTMCLPARCLQRSSHHSVPTLIPPICQISRDVTLQQGSPVCPPKLDQIPLRGIRFLLHCVPPSQHQSQFCLYINLSTCLISFFTPLDYKLYKG